MSTLAKSPRATTIAIYSLGFLLGSLHIFLGAVALTPMINHDYHREIKINYSAFAKTLLSIYDFSDRASVAFYLRILLSSAQAFFGALLVENGHFVNFDKYGNYGLLVVDAIFLCLQLSVGTSYERLAPTIVFAILLISRLVIVEQGARKAKGRQTSRPQRKISPKKKD